MAHLARGIAPELLVSQVENTMPYLFMGTDGDSALLRFPPARILREYKTSPSDPLSHFEYFRLCLSAHYLTCATPVPTDVDNQIRLKLWPAELPLDTALEMADLVLQSRSWDFAQVSARVVEGAPGTPLEKETLSGHLGEWFTVAAAAYCAFLRYSQPEARLKREELLNQIAEEVVRHSEIFGSLWRANDGLRALKASAAIAHNLGDLDRVMDMWDLSPGDSLRTFYKLGTAPFDSNRKLRYQGRLWVAGELYKSVVGGKFGGSSMALENPRHFALRKPRSLRRSRAFLVPTGPFFDEWGRTVARNLSGEDHRVTGELLEVVEALKQGWLRLPKTVGYGRGLRGILELHPELREQVRAELDRRGEAILDVSEKMFQQGWAEEAVRLMDEIPGRA